MEEKKKSLAETLRHVRIKLSPYIPLTHTRTWSLYILISSNQSRTYCGITLDFARRFAQHLGLCKGGARYTRMNGSTNTKSLSWEPVCILTGFPEGKAIRQLEWSMHHSRRIKNFKEFRDVFIFQNRSISAAIKKNAGIDYRLFALSYFVLKYAFIKGLRLIWFHPEFRKDIVWKTHEIDESFVDMTLFEDLTLEHKVRQDKKEKKQVP